MQSDRKVLWATVFEEVIHGCKKSLKTMTNSDYAAIGMFLSHIAALWEC